VPTDTQASCAASRTAVRASGAMPHVFDPGDGLPWTWEVLESFVEDVKKLKEAARAAVVSKLQRLKEGSRKVWRDSPTYDAGSDDLAQLAVETTRVGSSASIVWWVELDHVQGQKMVLYRLVRVEHEKDARTRAASYLCTFSDAYLRACMVRNIQHGIVLPFETSETFEWRRTASSEWASWNDDVRPVSLQKRYVMTQRHLDILKMHGMQGVQMPFVLYPDEVQALSKVMREPVFLLGRSGSGKTTVLVHAMFYTHIGALDFGYRPDTWELDESGELGPMLLVTRSPLLANAIRKVFDQMVAGSEQGEYVGEHRPEFDRGLKLGVLSDDEVARAEKLPDSFRKEDVSAGLQPVSASWASVLKLADASVPGEPFFRHGQHTETPLERAAQRQHRRVDGSYDAQDELTFEVFEREIAKQLLGPPRGMGPLNKGYNLLGVYVEMISKIAGSLSAVLSPSGCLSKEAYIAQGGDPAIYDAYGLYAKAKLSLRMWDRVDPVRAIFRRMRQHKMTLDKREEAFRMLSAVFIDEVQDLLPCELLLLRQFSKQDTGWVFAGDTAQTISKGIDFRFEDLRRLFFEDFLHGRELFEETKQQAPRPKCKMCNCTIVLAGGTLLECNSHYAAHDVNVCGDWCYNAFARCCEDKVRGGTAAVRKMHEWASGRGKLSCPLCGLFLKETPIAAQQGGTDESTTEASKQFQRIADLPPVSYLTKNHRSTTGILNIAGAVIDVLMQLFPDKVDRLPREVSKVVSESQPVFLHGIPFEQALRLMFPTNGTAGRDTVLEFGAQQAVLVWSESSRKQVKEQFPLSVVLTIHDAKGLEFSDVLIMRPFSDMAAVSPLNGGPRLWSLVFWYMKSAGWDTSGIDERRVPPLDVARDGLLCTWLKALYVAITRARERVWIYDDDTPEAVVAFLRASKAIRIVSSMEQAANDEELLRGFAQSSSVEEFISEGKEFLQGRRYAEAKLCFARAAEAGSDVAHLWEEFAGAVLLKQAAAIARRTARPQEYVKAANAFLAVTTSVEGAAQRPDELTPTQLREWAAECFIEGDQLQEAALAYEAAALFEKAADVWEAARKWRHAGDAWHRAERLEKALSAYFTGRAWPHLVDLAESLVGTLWGSDNAAFLQDMIRNTARRLAMALRNANAPPDSNWILLLRTCRLLPRGRKTLIFIKSLRILDLTLRFMEEEGRFTECAAVALEYRDFERSASYFNRANLPAVQERVLFFGWLRNSAHYHGQRCVALHLQMLDMPPAAQLSQLCCLSEWSLEQIYGDGDADVHSAPGLDGLRNVWREWDRLARSDRNGVGHSIHFRMLALLELVERIRSDRWTHQVRSGELSLLFETWARSLSHELDEMSRFGCVGERRPSQWVERAVFELLLVVQPPGMEREVLVLADILPPNVVSPCMSCDVMARIARAVALAWRLRLAVEKAHISMTMLERSRPSWAELDTALRQELHTQYKPNKVGAVGSQSMVRDAWEALEQAMRFRNTYAVRRALSYLGDVGNAILPNAQCLARLEQFRSTLLWDACFPQLPMTAVTQHECADVAKSLVRYEVDELLVALRKKSSIYLSDLLQGSAVLLFADRVDYHGVAALGQLIDKRWHWSAKTMVRTLETQQAASSVGRRLAAPLPQYDGLLNYFFMSWKVTEHIMFIYRKGRRLVAPQVFAFLVERIIVWSTVLLTCLSNATLPTSWVKTHLSENACLVALAGSRALPNEKRGEVMWIRKQVLKMLSEILNDSHGFTAWVNDYGANHAGMTMRYTTALLVCGGINWLRRERNDVVNTLSRIDLQHRLELMRIDGPLPRPMQLLIAAPPVDHHDEDSGRQFDRITPFLSAILEQVGDPLVILHRDDSDDQAPSWTTGKRPLCFYREWMPTKVLFALEVLSGFGDEGSEWPPVCTYARWTALKRVTVYRSGQGVCDFHGIGVRCAEVPQSETVPTAQATGRFMLDQDEGHVADEVVIHVDEEAALAFSVSEKTLPLRAVVVFKCLARRVRRLLERRADPQRMRRAVARSWLTAAGHDDVVMATYLAFVLPELERLEEESVWLHTNLRRDLNEILQLPGRSSNTVASVKYCEKALDALDELQGEAEEFVEHYRHNAAAVADMLRDVMQLRQGRKTSRRTLLTSLQHINMVHNVLRAALWQSTRIRRMRINDARAGIVGSR